MNSSLLLALVVTGGGGTALAIILLRSYTSSSTSQRLTFRPEDLGGFTLSGLTLSSLLCLYLELLLIRWISSEIRIFAYFKNFVLIACFLGFGIGCYLARRAIPVLALVVPPLFFVFVIAAPWQALRRLIYLLPVLIGASSEIQIWGVGNMPLTPTAILGLLIGLAVALPIFALVAVALIPFGQLVGWYLESARNGVQAYSVNVLASLAGIALYTGLCFLNQPPATWFVVAGMASLLFLWRLARLRWLVVASFAICSLALLFQPARGEVHWSPYQKLTLRPELMKGELSGYVLDTNDSGFQTIIDLSDRFVSRHPELFRDVPIGLHFYNLPFRIVPHPRSVLVLGSGMGNDVAAALRNGASRVTAVEIDPLIVKLGRRVHFERPYDSPRVRVVIDDARSFIQNSREKYDLILFAFLDSHTTTSHFTNIRIDNYVYTREALAAARKLLAPEGVLVVKFQARRTWIAGRLKNLLTSVFGIEPLHLDAPAGYNSSGSLFLSGSMERIRAALRDPQLNAYVRAQRSAAIDEHVEITTDDWPYFYQRDRGLPTAVVAISALLMILCLAAARGVGLHFRSIRFEFFFLGAGFLLLEAQIISRMALLFGTTWVVNSIVISVLLLFIVAANGAASALPEFPVDAAYVALLLSITFGYVLPLERFFFASFIGKAIAATLVFCLPVFFAGIVFIKRFAASGFSAEAIGSNILGALAGGIAESLSLWFGLRALLGLAAVFYLAAWLFSRAAAPALTARTSP